MSEDLLDTAEAARRLGVDPSRIRQLCRDGSLPCRRIGQRVLVVAAADLEAYRKQLTPGGRGWPAGKSRGSRGPGPVQEGEG
jgi:excisionase family DNA binding protein